METTEIKKFKDNDIVLDQFHEDLKNTADENNKVKMTDFKSPSFYLPPISKVYALLGFITNQKQLIDLLESTYDTQLNVSRTNKYAIFKQGVGLRTVSKIIGWLKLIPFPFEQLASKKVMVKVNRAIKAGSNAANWFSGVNSFQVSFERSGQTEHEFTLLFNFIEQRCNTEVAFLLDIKKEVKAGKLKSDDVEAAWNAQQPLWEYNPHIPKGTIKELANLALLHSQKKKLSEEQKLTFLEGYYYLTFDFYLEAITHYEIGYRLALGASMDKVKNEIGMISGAIYLYATDENIKTCFAGMLKMLKDTLSKLMGEVSYRKLASFIEIEKVDAEQPDDPLESRHYNQLKDWRKGINLPSDKKLTAFISNLNLYAEGSSNDLIFDMCKVVMAVDKLIAEKLNEAKNETATQEEIEVIIKKVLANIPSYYKANITTGIEDRCQ